MWEKIVASFDEYLFSEWWIFYLCDLRWLTEFPDSFPVLSGSFLCFLFFLNWGKVDAELCLDLLPALVFHFTSCQSIICKPAFEIFQALIHFLSFFDLLRNVVGTRINDWVPDETAVLAAILRVSYSAHDLLVNQISFVVVLSLHFRLKHLKRPFRLILKFLKFSLRLWSIVTSATGTPNQALLFLNFTFTSSCFGLLWRIFCLCVLRMRWCIFWGAKTFYRIETLTQTIASLILFRSIFI